MQLISPTQLNQWADKIESRYLLPEFVKKLVYASKHGLTKVDIPSGEQIQQPGWDGVVVSESNADNNEVFLPNGTCLIEMGTNKNPRAKADDDYIKRCADSLGFDCKSSTFVFITPRDWAGGRDWELDKIKEGKWKNVKVITATILADWIEQCPSVNSWLCNVMGVPIDIMDIETYWKQWSTNSKGQKLDLTFAISGRDKESQRLIKLLETPTSICVVSKSSNESLAFVVASILKNGDDQKANRTIISKDNSTTEFLVNTYDNQIILHFGDNSLKYDKNVVERGTSIVYFTTPNSVNNTCLHEITLPQTNVESFIESLTITLGDENLARQYAHDTGKNISILRRRLGFNGAMPQWSQPEIMVNLLPAFIIGMWNENYDGDKEAVSLLAHKDYAEYSQLVNVLLHKEDSPFIKVGSEWLVKSPYDVMMASLPYIKDNKEIVDKVKEISTNISNDVDTSLKEDWNNPINLHQFNLRYSLCIRKGILHSLIIISVFSNDIDLTDFVDNIIRDSVKPSIDWWLTSCHSDILSLMAEASPHTLLEIVEDDLESEESIIKTIFKNDFSYTGWLGDGTHYTHILMSIETAAWMPECLLSATEILLSLCKLGEKKGWVNNAFSSLKDIFHVFFPHTFADTNQRIEVLKSMADSEPELTFKLCINLLKERRGGVTTSSYSTLWRTFGKYQPVVTKQEEYEKFMEGCIEICTQKRDIDEEEYLSLVKVASDRQTPLIPFDGRKKVLSKLQSSTTKFKGDQKILKELHRLDYINYELSDRDHQKRYSWEKVLLGALEPEDIVEKELWKFSEEYEEPSTYDKDFHKIHDKKDKNREIAFRKIMSLKGIDGIESLVEKADSPNYIGLYLAKEKDHSNYVSFVLKHRDIQGLAGTYFRCIYYEDSLFFDDIIKYNDYDVNTKLYILSCINVIDDSIKGYLDKSTEEFRKQFWETASSNLYLDKKHLEYVCSEFCKVNRFADAIRWIHSSKYDDIEISTSTIVKALSGIFTHPKQLQGNQIQYYVDGLIEILDKREDASDKEVVEIEFLYSVWRNDPISKDFRLVRTLYNDPHFMYSMIKCVYYPEHRDENAPLPTQKERNTAEACYRILYNLRSLPYINDKGIIDGVKLNDYVAELYNYGVEDDRKKVTSGEIGSFLGNVPINDAFPQDEVCWILEHYRSKEMLNAFRIRLYNRRGMSSRLPLEGGDQERDIAHFIDKCIERTKVKYPHVANNVFRVLKQEFLGEAKRMDIDAELERYEI